MGKNYYWHSDAVGGIVVSTRNTKHDRSQQGCSQGLDGASDTHECRYTIHYIFDIHAVSQIVTLKHE